jgi:hypothetical protein
LLRCLFWVAAMSVLCYPGCGGTHSSRVSGVYTIRKFGAFGYYSALFSPSVRYTEGFNSEALFQTIGGSVLVSAACLLEARRTLRHNGADSSTEI